METTDLGKVSTLALLRSLLDDLDRGSQAYEEIGSILVGLSTVDTLSQVGDQEPVVTNYQGQARAALVAVLPELHRLLPRSHVVAELSTRYRP